MTNDANSATSARVDHVIICGLGTLGYRIFLQLEKLGLPVVAVDAKPDAQFAARVEAAGARMVRSDPRDPAALAQADIGGASALITSFDNDLLNLQICLGALRIRPGLRIVMRFFNADASSGIGRSLPNVTLLSVSALASPTFALAATDRYARNAMSIDGQDLVVDDLASAVDTTIAQLHLDDAVVIAVRRPAGDLFFPPQDQAVAVGDRLVVVGPAASLAPLPALLGRPVIRPRQTLLDGPRQVLAHFVALLANLDRALYVTLLALLALVVISVLILVSSRHMDGWEALYAVMLAVTSTDVGEFDPQSETLWLRPYGIFLLVAGVASLTIIYAFVTNYVVSVKLSGLLGQRRVTLRDHIVLCGLGTVGYRVLNELLARGERVAVIERDDNNRFLPLLRAQSPRTPVFVADARLLQSLELVNIGAARCIITATDDDMGNIETALNARQLQPTIRVVLRTFDQVLAQQVADSFNIQIAFSTTALAAPAFVSAALGHSAVQSLTVGESLFSVVRLIAPPTGPAIGKPLDTLTAGLSARVIYQTHRNERPVFNPAAARRIAPGDIIVLVAADNASAALKARLAP